MARYFVAGNLWLVAALVLHVGRTFARSEPTMYSFFGMGRWFYPESYSLLVGVCAAIGILLLILSILTRKPRNGVPVADNS